MHAASPLLSVAQTASCICCEFSNLVRAAVSTARSRMDGGWSHSWERPTSSGSPPTAQTISVADGSSETTHSGRCCGGVPLLLCMFAGGAGLCCINDAVAGWSCFASAVCAWCVEGRDGGALRVNGGDRGLRCRASVWYRCNDD